MKMTKKISSLVLLVLIIGILGAVFVLSGRFIPQPLYGDEEWVTHTLNGLDLSFQYRKIPNGYLLVSQPTEERGVISYSLFKNEEYEELQNSSDPREGPPVLSITAIPIEGDDPLESFIKTNPLSGYMEGVSELEPIFVGGEEAYRYRADGLYPADVTVVKHRSVAYVFYAMYLTPEESRRTDFAQVVESVSFTE